MKTYRIVIPGRAVPAPRMTTRSKWIRRQAQRYLAYKEYVGYHARQAVPEPLRGSVRVVIDVYLAGGRIGDWDNYGASLSNSLNGIAWKDDCQVVDGRVRLRETTPERERVEVVITGLEEE